MSNISGDTFFIENSVNCSDLGTINGSVSFLDTSSNCGQVLNAIFSGGVNCGQACGCTVFYNSCSFGYICGTGILRGNSVLYGAADCVIQCDQSTIDAGASVVSCEFLVTTGTPTNIYSNDSCYYIYSNGTSTLATGAWSNGYFSNGSACQTLWDNVSVLLTACAQDSNLYYEYADYSTCIANGTYKNGYFCNGLLVNVVDRGYPDYDPNFCILYPIKPVPGLSVSEYTQYCCDGTPRDYEDGLYILRDGSIRFIQNKCHICANFVNNISIHKIKNTCPAVHGNFYWLFYNNSFCSLYASSDSYVTSSGYFSVDAGVNLGLGENRDALRIENSYTCSTPALAIDDCLYYTYCTGIPSLASGLYSNFAINGGVIDCSYSTNTPTGAIDSGCQIYEAGTGICVTGVSYILDDGNYYGRDEASFSYKSSELPNTYEFLYAGLYDIKLFKSNCNLGAFIQYGGEAYSTSALMNISTLYCSVGALSGVFFTYNNKSFKSSNANDYCFEIETTFNQETPLEVLSGIYFLYCNGSGIVPNGLYSNYAFDNSVLINTNYNCTLPQIPLDNCCYYVYSGGVATGATGAYSSYYFEPATSIATGCSITTPIAAQDNCIFYTYCDGCSAIVTGYRNDAPGYDGSPSGIYNFGDTGEYNPVPCFVVLGAFTDCYYTIGGANQNYYIHAESVLDCADVGGWIYGSNGGGINPATLGFTNITSNNCHIWVSEVSTCCDCSSSVTNGSTFSVSQCIYSKDPIILINNSGITGFGACNIYPINIDIIFCSLYCNTTSYCCYLYDEYNQNTGEYTYCISDYGCACGIFCFSSGTPLSVCYISNGYVEGVNCSSACYCCAYAHNASDFWSIWSGFGGCANFI